MISILLYLKGLTSMKKFFIYLIVFICAFFLFFYISMGSVLYCDEIWVYGFSHNILNGMMIYKDFNVLQMPLYFFISSFFLNVFGDKIISMHIFDCILIGFLFSISYKKYGCKSTSVLLLLIVGYSGYNLLSLFLFMIIFFLLSKDNDNDFLVGILIGLIFITKQNIGLVLFFPYIYYSKKKLRSIFYFLIPFVIISFYFIANKSFFVFIDCVFGSMFDFNEHNKMITPIFFLVEICVIIHLIILFFKFRSRDKRILFVLFFQMMSYPIFDDKHIFLPLIPYFYLLYDYSFSLKQYWFLVVLIGYSFAFFPYQLKNIHMSSDIFFMRNDNNINFLFFQNISNKQKQYDYIFIGDWYGYAYKLYYNIPINQYDFLLSGNAGYHGVQKRIKEIDNLCKEKLCLFVIRNKEFIQWKEFNAYVKNNYQYIDNKYNFRFYKSW